jgi:mitochondrial fission protein ELM1
VAGRLALLGGSAAALSRPGRPGRELRQRRRARRAGDQARRAAARTRLVHIQDPRVARARFDSRGAAAARPCSAARQRHRDARRGFTDHAGAAGGGGFGVARSRSPRFPRPLAAVLVGGSEWAPSLHASDRRTPRRRAATPRWPRTARDRADDVAAHRPRMRRAAARAARAARRLPVDRRGDNPYLGLLAHADAILATEDSVSMVSEACATGKPVYWVRARGAAPSGSRASSPGSRPMASRDPSRGRLERWSYAPPDDTSRVAAELRRRFGW